MKRQATPDPEDNLAELRQRAEELVARREPPVMEVNSLEDAQQLIFELQVHQIELEMQNDELRLAQVQLADEREKYADLYNFAPVAYFTLDDRDIILDLNLTGAGLLGNERRYLIDRPLTPYLTPASLQTFIQHRHQALATRQPQTCELTIRPRDGTTFEVQARTVALSPSPDTPQRWRTVMTDITERKRAERSLKDNLLLLHKIIDSSVDLIVVKDRELRTVLCNTAFASALGKNPSDLYGKTDIENGWHPEVVKGDPEKHIRGFEQDDRLALHGEVVRNPSDPANVGNTILYFDTIKLPLRDTTGEIVGVLGISRDMTARRQAEEVVQKSEKRFRALMENSADGLTLLDARGKLVYEGPTIPRLTGYALGERLDNSAFDFVFPADRAAAQAALARVLAAPGYQETVELRLVRKDGAEWWAEVTATNLLAEPAVQAVVINYRDITDRKRAEERIRQAHDFYLKTLRNAPALIWRSGLDAKCDWFNQTWIDFTGRTLEQEMGNGWAEGVHPDDFQDCLQTYLAAFEARQPFEMEYRLRHHTGDYRWILDIGRPLLDLNDQFSGYIGYCFDITANKQAEEKVRESEARYRRLVEGAPAVVYTFSNQRGGLYYSPLVEHVLGYSLEYLYAHPYLWNESIHPEDRRLIDEALRQSEEGRPFEIEYRIRDAHGEWRWLLDRSIGRRVEDTEVLVEGLVTDITERKRAESQREAALELLRASETFNQAVLDNSPIGISVRDRTGRLLSANAAWRKIWAIPETVMFEDVSRKRQALIFNERDDYLRPYQAEVRRVYEQGGHLHLPELKTTRSRPGAAEWLSQHFYAIQDEHGQVDRVVILTEDITARKQAEAQREAALEALRQLNAELEQRVAERTSELTKANVRLAELSSLKDEFITRISHELRTPLANIKLYIQLLEQGKPEKRESYFQTLREQTDRLQRLIEDLLDVSHLSLNEVGVRAVVFNVDALLRELVSDCTSLALERGLTLTALPAPDRPTLNTDRTLLRQALVNVLTNALNYTPRAGTVTLRADRVATPEGEWVTIEVRDTGPGILEQDLPRIFEPFYRGAAAANYKIPGTGVGLSMAQRLIERLGGRITVESPPGQGVAFTVWLK